MHLVPLAMLACLFSQTATPPPREITRDTTLDPQKTYGPITIKVSNITVDGRGAAIVGVPYGDPKTFKGVGILAEGASNVTLKNVKARGWETLARLRQRGPQE